MSIYKFRWCGLLGHKWKDETDYKKYCCRDNCLAIKSIKIERFTKIGESQYNWDVDDWKMLKS